METIELILLEYMHYNPKDNKVLFINILIVDNLIKIRISKFSYSKSQ